MQGKEKRPMGGTRSIKIPLQEAVCIICPGKAQIQGDSAMRLEMGMGRRVREPWMPRWQVSADRRVQLIIFEIRKERNYNYIQWDNLGQPGRTRDWQKKRGKHQEALSIRNRYKDMGWQWNKKAKLSKTTCGLGEYVFSAHLTRLDGEDLYRELFPAQGTPATYLEWLRQTQVTRNARGGQGVLLQLSLYSVAGKCSGYWGDQCVSTLLDLLDKE